MFQPWKGPPWDNRESHSHITWRCQVEASRRSARLCIEDRFWGLEDLFGILVEPLLKQSCQHHDKSSATSLSAGTSVVWSPFSHPGICKPLGQRKCTATRWFQTTSLSLSNPVQDILQAKAHPKQPESWRVEMALFWYHLMRTARSTSICKHHSDRKAAQNRRDHKGSLNHLVLLDIKAHIYDNDQMCTTDLMARHRSKLCTDPVNSSSQPPNKHASPPMWCKCAPCQKGECDHTYVYSSAIYVLQAWFCTCVLQ